MYEIILKTWYQERPKNTEEEEVFRGLAFNDMESAARYLGKHIDEILDEYPVAGEIKIKYKNQP